MERAQLQRVFDRLRSPHPPRVLCVYAHPDDEVIALGARLAHMHNALFLQVTDGAPADNADGQRLGLTRDEYRSARALELRAAFGAAGLPEARHRCLNHPDKEAAFHLLELTGQIAEVLAAERPEVVFTHPYEGGHADHDACAFAVHQAVAATDGTAPLLLESPFYFRSGDGTARTGTFLHSDPSSELVLPLYAAEVERKRAAFDAFDTQRPVLAMFQAALREERFRIAPGYDFTRPAAPGPAYYESFIPGITASSFARLAADALAATQSEPSQQRLTAA